MKAYAHIPGVKYPTPELPEAAAKKIVRKLAEGFQDPDRFEVKQIVNP